MSHKLLPCEARPTKIIKGVNDLGWVQWTNRSVKCLSMEIIDMEAPNHSLLGCKTHTYVLMQVLFRLANYVKSQGGKVFAACSVLDLCESNPYGYVFWLIYEDAVIDGERGGVLRTVVEDILLINNSHRPYHELLQTDFVPHDIQPSFISQRNLYEGKLDDIDDAAPTVGYQTDGYLFEKPLSYLNEERREFHMEVGYGNSYMKKFKGCSSGDADAKSLPKLSRLSDFDKMLELYHFYQFSDQYMDDDKESFSEIPDVLRGKDNPTAWRRRYDLLSPDYLFHLSVRRQGANKDVEKLFRTLQAQNDDDEDVYESGDPTLDNVARAMLRNTTWELDSEMLQPTYFLSRTFPSVRRFSSTQSLIMNMSGGSSTSDAKRGIAHLYVNVPETSEHMLTSTAYRCKNGGILTVKDILDKLGCTPDSYLDARLLRSYHAIYQKLHKSECLNMASVIKTSYKDANQWFDVNTGFTSRCLNAMRSQSTNCRVPFVFAESGNNLDIGYQFLFNLLRLVSFATGMKHTLVELLYVLLSGIKQLKPHKSMSFHGLFLGPPGSGKSRLMSVARAIIGNEYSFVLNYRSRKSALVPQNHDLSKRVCFNPEFVTNSTNERGGGNPLAVEQSAESASMKEELDTGYTRSRRVEMMTDPTTGHTSHINVETENVCDYATFMAMNEKNICASLDSRMVTFEVPPCDTTVVPSDTDTLEFKVNAFFIPVIYGAIRHIIMETSRLQEVGLFPRRMVNDDPIDYRSMIMTWERLSEVCERTGIIYGLKHDLRARGRVFEMAILLAEIFGVVRVYGCPPKTLHVAGDFEQTVEAHIRHLQSKSPEHLHNEVCVEKVPDPADVITAFSIHYQFLEKDRTIANAIVMDADAIDPTIPVEMDEFTAYFELQYSSEEILIQKLERTTGLTSKRCKEALSSLSNLKFNGKYVFKRQAIAGCMRNKPQHKTLLLASYAAQVYVAEKGQTISRLLLDMLQDDSCKLGCCGRAWKIITDKQMFRELAMLHYLQPLEEHNRDADGHPRPSFQYVSGPPYQEEDHQEMLLSLDLGETRLKFVRSRALIALREKRHDVNDDGYIVVDFENAYTLRKLRALQYRLLTSTSRDNRVVRPMKQRGQFAVHWSIFASKYKTLMDIEQVRAKCLQIGYCNNDYFNHIDLTENSFQTLPPICNHRAKFPCLRLLDDTRAEVSLLCLNETEESAIVSSKESIMQKVVEKSVFHNMTERKSVVFVDRSRSYDPNDLFSTFQVMDIENLKDKYGGKLPEYTCQNPYRNNCSMNRTIREIQGDDIGAFLSTKEPDQLKGINHSVSMRKAYLSLLADGTVRHLQLVNQNSVENFSIQLLNRMKKRRLERMQLYEPFQFDG